MQTVTLIDSIERIVTSLQFASETVCTVQLDEARARSVIGLGLHEAIEQLHPGLDAVQLEAFAAAYRQNFLYDSDVPEVLFDGVEDLLQQLSDEAYMLAVATGKSRAGLDRAINQHGLGRYFNATRCAGEHRSKPHPEMLDSILHELGARPGETIMIGDSRHDMLMAESAGVHAIGVSHGVDDAASLMRHGPLTCLDRVTDLNEFLSHNTGVGFNTNQLDNP